MRPPSLLSFFFFNDTATTEIYTLSLHDALPIYSKYAHSGFHAFRNVTCSTRPTPITKFAAPANAKHPASRNAKKNWPDRKSTRLNSSHQIISYAVFCLKKKKIQHVSDSTIKTRS